MTLAAEEDDPGAEQGDLWCDVGPPAPCAAQLIESEEEVPRDTSLDETERAAHDRYGGAARIGRLGRAGDYTREATSATSRASRAGSASTASSAWTTGPDPVAGPLGP